MLALSSSLQEHAECIRTAPARRSSGPREGNAEPRGAWRVPGARARWAERSRNREGRQPSSRPQYDDSGEESDVGPWAHPRSRPRHRPHAWSAERDSARAPPAHTRSHLPPWRADSEDELSDGSWYQAERSPRRNRRAGYGSAEYGSAGYGSAEYGGAEYGSGDIQPTSQRASFADGRRDPIRKAGQSPRLVDSQRERPETSGDRAQATHRPGRDHSERAIASHAHDESFHDQPAEPRSEHRDAMHGLLHLVSAYTSYARDGRAPTIDLPPASPRVELLEDRTEYPLVLSPQHVEEIPARPSRGEQVQSRAEALEAMRAEGKAVRRVGAIKMLTAPQVKDQLALRSLPNERNARAGSNEDRRKRLEGLVTAEVAARETADGPDAVTSDAEAERLYSLGLGRKRRSKANSAQARKKQRPPSVVESSSSEDDGSETEVPLEELYAPDVHKVERILDVREVPGSGREFLIKWQGWSAKWNGELLALPRRPKTLTPSPLACDPTPLQAGSQRPTFSTSV